MKSRKITINNQVFEFQPGPQGLMMITEAGGVKFVTAVKNVQNLNAIAVEEYKRLRPLLSSVNTAMKNDNQKKEVKYEVAI